MQKINFIALFTTQLQIQIEKLKEYLKYEKSVEGMLEAKINAWLILSVFFYFLGGKSVIKSNHKGHGKNKVHTFRACFFHLII